MTRTPVAYVAILAALLALGVLIAIVALGVPPFDSVAVFVLSNVASAFTLLILAVVGGAFVGMLLAHRILSSREFTPFERTMLEGLADIRQRLDELEERAREREPRERLRP